MCVVVVVFFTLYISAFAVAIIYTYFRFHLRPLFHSSSSLHCLSLFSRIVNVWSVKPGKTPRGCDSIFSRHLQMQQKDFRDTKNRGKLV